jgi:hypothetical protein
MRHVILLVVGLMAQLLHEHQKTGDVAGNDGHCWG